MTDNLELLKELHNGNDELEEEIVKNNMGLVMGIAKRYYNRGYDMEELIQVGSLGLIKAIRKFDEGFGVRFSITFFCKQIVLWKILFIIF